MGRLSYGSWETWYFLHRYGSLRERRRRDFTWIESGPWGERISSGTFRRVKKGRDPVERSCRGVVQYKTIHDSVMVPNVYVHIIEKVVKGDTIGLSHVYFCLTEVLRSQIHLRSQSMCTNFFKMLIYKCSWYCIRRIRSPDKVNVHCLLVEFDRM